MRRVQFSEVWTDDRGVIAVMTASGDYSVYVLADNLIVDGRPLLAHSPRIAQRVLDTKTQIYNALRRSDKNSG